MSENGSAKRSPNQVSYVPEQLLVIARAYGVDRELAIN